MRPRDVFLGVGGLVALVASLGLLAFGHGQDRFGGLPVLCFSLALLSAPLSGRLAARSGIHPHLDRVEHDGALLPALIVPGSAVKLKVMRCGLVCLAAGSALLAVQDPDARVIGIACAVVFAAAALATLRLSPREWRIALLPSGLEWRVGGAPAFVAWDDVTAVTAFDIRDTYYLGLKARPEAIRTPAGGRWLAWANRAISGMDASFALEPFPVEPDRLADAVAGCARDPDMRRAIGTEQSLAWLGEAPLRAVTASSSTA
jgi:hypothetical protein